MKKKDIMKHISGLTIEFGSVDSVKAPCDILKVVTECITIELYDPETHKLAKCLSVEKKLIIAVLKNDLNEYLNGRAA